MPPPPLHEPTPAALRAIAVRLRGDSTDLENCARLANAAVVAIHDLMHMGKAHQLVRELTYEFRERFRRNVYVTPKTYLSFIQSYREVYRAKVANIETMASSINSGLFKLEQASSDVEKMKIELKEKEKTLSVAKEKSGVLLQELNSAIAAWGHGRLRSEDGDHLDIGGSTGGGSRRLIDGWVMPDWREFLWQSDTIREFLRSASPERG